jgi:hypothetical protein
MLPNNSRATKARKQVLITKEMKAGGAPTSASVAVGDLVLQMLNRSYHELGKRLKECG